MQLQDSTGDIASLAVENLVLQHRRALIPSYKFLPQHLSVL